MSSSFSHFCKIIIGVILVLGLSACITTIPNEPSEPGTVAMDRNKLPPQPDETPPANRGARAVADLIAASQAEYQRGEWHGAIATAERALRIDRRQPQIYLLMAKSYRALGDTRQARQFAEQGLRYIEDDNSPVAQDLQWLVNTLR